MPDRREPLLEVTDLRCLLRSERGLVHAVDGVSFAVSPGESVGVVGESGSGKTVMLRALMGLVSPRRAEISGSVRFLGREMVAAPQHSLRELWGDEIAMIFQDSLTALNPVQKIGRQVVESLRSRQRMSRADSRARAIELLTSVGIPDAARRVDSYPHELSGGMRQRAVIAGALAAAPSLLLADEPTTALDVTVQAQILNLIEDLRAERDMGVILVTHDLGVVAGRTDRTAVMYAGQVVEMAPTPRLFQATRMPYTRALLDSMPAVGSDRQERLRVIEGRPPVVIEPSPGCRFAPRCVAAAARCHAETPPLTTDGDDHWYRCWYPLDPPSAPVAVPVTILSEPVAARGAT